MRAALLCVLLTACNPVFGLDETISVDAAVFDFDHDGVTDASDNCPTLANADQANGDGDAFGDACDLCPTVGSTANHDEDQDSLGDACDVCPGVENFNDDADDDGIGDICDPAKDTPGDVRRAFETFVTVPPEWQTTGVSWMALGDSTSPAMALPNADDGLVNTMIAPTAPWLVNVGYESDHPWTIDDLAGIEVRVGGHTIRCEQNCTATPCQVWMSIDGQGFGTSARPQPFSRITFDISSNGTISCYCNGPGIVTTPTTFTPTGPATLSLIAAPRERITYFEYLE